MTDKPKITTNPTPTHAETIRVALDRATMMLCGYGANNTVFLHESLSALAAMETERKELVEALDEAVSGLQWRVENDPPDLVDECDHEKLAKWKAILTRLGEK